MVYGWDVSAWNLTFASVASLLVGCGPDTLATSATGEGSSGTGSVSAGEVGGSTVGPGTADTTSTGTTTADASTLGEGPCTEDADCEPDSQECVRGECVPRDDSKCYYESYNGCCEYGDGFGGCADCESQDDCDGDYPVCKGLEPVGYCAHGSYISECFGRLEPVLIPLPDTSVDGATALAFVDADADAPQDLVAVVEGEVRLLLGPATAPAATLEHGTGVAQAVVGGDFDGDGDGDIVVSTTGPDLLTVLLGDGSGVFSIAASTSLPAAAPTIIAGDFDDDGNDDIGALAGQQLAVLLSDGVGGFSDPLALTPDSTVTSVTSGEMNVDGRVDLAFDLAGEVTVWLGNGSGDATIEAMGDAARFSDATVTVASRQRPGAADTRVFALLGLPERTLTTQWRYPSAANSQGGLRGLSGQFVLAAGLQYDRGGETDVAVAGGGGLAVVAWDDISLCLTPISVGHPTDVLATGDIDGDGLDEIVVAGPLATSVFDFQ